MAARVDGGYCQPWRDRVTIPRDSISLLCELLTGMPRFDDVPACQGQPALFDGDDANTWPVAIGMCESCPVLAQCRRYAQSHPEIVGVIGGMLRPPGHAPTHRVPFASR